MKGSLLSCAQCISLRQNALHAVVPREPHPFAFAYARGLQRAKRYPEAVQEFERIIAAFDGPPDAMIGKGDALFAMKRHDEALAAYAQAVEKRPDHHAYYGHMAAQLMVLKRYEKAIAPYEKAIALDPSNAKYQAGLKGARSKSRGD